MVDVVLSEGKVGKHQGREYYKEVRESKRSRELK